MAFSDSITTDRSRPDLGRGVLIVTCAISAGIHGALIREHLAEGAGAGGGFIAATVLLIGLAVALSRGAGETVVLASAIALAGLIVAYGFAVATGVPFLHADVEPINGLAVFTKVVESVGLAAALLLLGTSVHELHLHPHERTAK